MSASGYVPSALGTPRGPGVLGCVLFALFYWGPEMLVRDLWEPDEARFAYVAGEMAQEGHALVPHRNGEFYAHKPPFMFWLNQGFSRFNGGKINAVTSRLPSVLASAATLYVTSRLAILLWGGLAGWVAPLLLATSFQFWKTTGMGQVDALLLGLQLSSFGLLVFAPDVAGKRPRGMWVAAYLLMGLAILTKGPVGLLIPYGSWICFTLGRGDTARLRRSHLGWGPVLALVPVACWLGAMLLWEPPPPGYLEELLFKQNVGRVDGSFARGHLRPFWYFLKYLPVDFLPWTLLLPAAVVALIREKSVRPALKGLLAWAAFVVIFFSIPATKRNLYILSVYPVLALLLAGGWERRRSRGQVPERLLAGFLVLLGTVFIAAGPVQNVLPEAPPLNLWVFLPTGMVFFFGGLLLWRRTDSLRWLSVAATAVGTGLILFALFVYPAVNPLKVPFELVEAANRYPPDRPELLLFRMHGEIQALTTGLRGRELHKPEEIQRVLELEEHALLVVKERDWAELVSLPEFATAMWGEYSMGSKTLRWVAFGRQSGTRR